MRKILTLSILLLFVVLLGSCGRQRQIAGIAKKQLIEKNGLNQSHIGIHVYEPATGKVWYDYQGDHYFVPASNTKIPTCYATMHFLGDSIPALQYREVAGGLAIRGTGDPAFLLPEYTDQPAWAFLQQQSVNNHLYIDASNWKDQPWGSGWSWNDYMENYMAEKSPLPIYGNLIQLQPMDDKLIAFPSFFNKGIRNASVSFPDSARLVRGLADNSLLILPGTDSIRKMSIPFAGSGYGTVAVLLQDTLQLSEPVSLLSQTGGENEWQTIYSRPVDSILKPMMHRSDNFFAEQSLLMVSQHLFGEMNAHKVIDTLLHSLFSGLPQPPRWVDGSGLSRYNLFSPQDFVWILNKIREEQGMDRVRLVFPTGGEGTISSYYQADSGYIFVKTGTLSNVVALSGFLQTRKDRLLIFSMLVNSHQLSATLVRENFQRILTEIRSRY